MILPNNLKSATREVVSWEGVGAAGAGAEETYPRTGGWPKLPSFRRIPKTWQMGKLDKGRRDVVARLPSPCRLLQHLRPGAPPPRGSLAKSRIHVASHQDTCPIPVKSPGALNQALRPRSVEPLLKSALFLLRTRGPKSNSQAQTVYSILAVNTKTNSKSK